MNFSIIIPFKEVNTNLLNCLDSINNLNYENFEVILVPDNEIKLIKNFNFHLLILPSGEIMPGLKRDLAVEKSNGKVLAFLDDDAQPHEEWLNIAYSYFFEKKESVIGGPGIDTSDREKNLLQNLSDIFFKSKFFGVPDRYIQGKTEKYYDDWPSVNLMVKKSLFKKINGFQTNHWPGEDTVLCSKLKKEGIAILYVPKLFVYHVRRVDLKKLTKQVFNYGYKRGLFFFEFPNNSRSFKFFMPSFFLAYIISLFFFSNGVNVIPIIIYIIVSIYNYLKFSKNFLSLFIFPFFCMYNHIIYGFAYLFGFSKKFFFNK